jgi:protein AroM
LAASVEETKKVGFVTIGQSPRRDIVPAVTESLGRGVAVMESGALDGMTRDEIAQLAPHLGDDTLVSALADGSEVALSARLVMPIMESRMEEMFMNGADVVVPLCTGEIRRPYAKGLVLFPQKALYNFVKTVSEGCKVGVLVPSPEQTDDARRYWSEVCEGVEVTSLSPYSHDAASQSSALEYLARRGIGLTVLDCVGYSDKVKREALRVTGRPVILARSVLAGYLAELLGGSNK